MSIVNQTKSILNTKLALFANSYCRYKPTKVVALCGLFVAVPIVFGILSLAIGKDMNWDLLNYHYYNAYALLTWRYNTDVAPAQLQTWFNPALDVPWYLMMRYLSSSTVGFLIGATQGLNFSFVFLIAWQLIRIQLLAARGLVAIACATFGCLGPIFLTELGSTQHDTTLSVLVLAAILLLVAVSNNPSAPRTRTLVAAGILLGAATALKLTNAVYALGATLALCSSVRFMEAPVRKLFIFCVSGAAAGLLLFGPWMWFLWERFGNPLFPVYNNLFQSPWVQQHKFAFDAFLPGAAWEYTVWPLIFSADPHRVWEWKFEDYRFALLWIVGLLYLVGIIYRAPWSTMIRHDETETGIQRASANFIFYFTFFSFSLWMYMYSAFRYLAPLELLAPLVFGLVLARMQLSLKFLVIVLTVVALMSAVVLDVPDRERYSWDEKYINVDVGEIESPKETLVLMLGGGAPMAYVIPEFPSGVRFLRPDGNLGLKKNHLMMKQITKTVRRHAGTIYFLFASAQKEKALRNALKNFGLIASSGSCRKLQTNAPDRLIFCIANSAGPKGT